MLGIRIPIRLDPDLLGQIRFPHSAMAVGSAIFQSLSKIGTGIRVIANPPDLRTLILLLLKH
jgi:hypothetical protein